MPMPTAFSVLIAIVVLLSTSSDCRVIVDKLKETVSDVYPGCFFPLSDKNSGESSAPLILNTTQPNLVYPGIGQHDVWVATGEKVQIFCPGNGNAVVAKSVPNNHDNIVPAHCTNNGEVSTSSGVHDSLEITCKRPPRSRAIDSGKICARNNTEITIGFPTNGTLVTIFRTCFDKQRKEALYAHHTVSKAIKFAAKGVSRPPFDPADFYDDIPVNDLYKQATQFESLAEILNSTELARRYIKPKSAKTFLARGHLAPKADFVYAPEQRATFYHVNVAPQWMTFNAGNWNSLEMSVRNLVDTIGRDLDVYTGTYGVSTLPDAKGKQRELFLYIDENNNRAVPVPKVFWKLVYDRSRKAGVVVVGVNNPYVNPIPEDYFLCENDVCDELSWLSVDRKKISKGYMYCCQVDDFRESVRYLPYVTVTELLT